MRQIIVRLLVVAAIASGFVLGGMATAVPTGATDSVNSTSTPFVLVSNEDCDDDDCDDDDCDDNNGGLLGFLL